MKILILGRGQLAHAYLEHFAGSDSWRAVMAERVDIRDVSLLSSLILKESPDVVINTAAKTNLDWCEQNKLECFDTNTLGADTVGRVCHNLNVRLVHISTGCIHESLTENDTHSEMDPPTPTSFYSWSKYWADEMLLLREKRGLKLLILRPRQPISAKVSSRNALVKMLTYTKFIDTPNSMTVIEDFVDVTEQLLDRGTTGLFNVANPGIMTPYRLALRLKEKVKPDMNPVKITKDELNAMTYAARIDSVLDCSKLAKEGIVLKDISARLDELLKTFAANLAVSGEILARTQQETAAKLALKKS